MKSLTFKMHTEHYSSPEEQMQYLRRESATGVVMWMKRRMGRKPWEKVSHDLYKELELLREEVLS